MSTPEPRHQAALDRFLRERPPLAESLEHLNPLQAQAAGLSMAQYRAERLHEAFEEFAQQQGLFAWELTLQLTCASAEEFEAQRLEVHREVAEMAHMSWAEYAELHGLKG
ncbi:DUF6388 family protein [Pseudomonas sp. HR96]|uniref:DUF6388 family protein n=1 Tax=Pseudomonas sp. HR96 TaxID=1027966 RepID=UPI002A75930E|nr:DUF6388 family protein [Pseudomonas sp. HR96]WPO98382.1 DUF6388 family protein [Pseudomonas sp. HR96]